MKVLVLDNYDSFTYNLVHCVNKVTNNLDVFRNDEISLDQVAKYDKILLSPGPGIPNEANLLKPIIETYANTKSILGVCLGLQAITEVFGGKLLNTKTVFHGVATEINIIKEDYIFKNLEKRISVGRYHSWIADRSFFPDTLDVTAETDDKIIMALQHKSLDVRGVQFHPESILTPQGNQIIENWLKN